MNEQAKVSGGFSLVEIIAAIMILSVGLLAMAGSTTYISAQLRANAFDTQRNLARQQVIEQLRGTFFNSITTNSTGLSVGRYNVKWVVTQPTTTIRSVAVITTGPAARSGSKGVKTTVVDTATIEIGQP